MRHKRIVGWVDVTPESTQWEQALDLRVFSHFLSPQQLLWLLSTPRDEKLWELVSASTKDFYYIYIKFSTKAVAHGILIVHKTLNGILIIKVFWILCTLCWVGGSCVCIISLVSHVSYFKNVMFCYRKKKVLICNWICCEIFLLPIFILFIVSKK